MTLLQILGQLFPKKRADIVGAYYYMHKYGFVPDFRAIVPEKGQI